MCGKRQIWRSSGPQSLKTCLSVQQRPERTPWTGRGRGWKDAQSLPSNGPQSGSKSRSTAGATWFFSIGKDLETPGSVALLSTSRAQKLRLISQVPFPSGMLPRRPARCWVVPARAPWTRALTSPRALPARAWSPRLAPALLAPEGQERSLPQSQRARTLGGVRTPVQRVSAGMAA